MTPPDGKIEQALDPIHSFGSTTEQEERSLEIGEKFYNTNDQSRMIAIDLLNKFEQGNVSFDEVINGLPENYIKDFISYSGRFPAREITETAKESLREIKSKMLKFLKDYQDYKIVLGSKDGRKFLSSVTSVFDSNESFIKRQEASVEAVNKIMKDSYMERTDLFFNEYLAEQNRTTEHLFKYIKSRFRNLKSLDWKNYFTKKMASIDAQANKNANALKNKLKTKPKNFDTPEFDIFDAMIKVKNDLEIEMKKHEEFIDKEEDKVREQLASLSVEDGYSDFADTLKIRDNLGAQEYVKRSAPYVYLNNLFNSKQGQDPKYKKCKDRFDKLGTEYFDETGELADSEYQFHYPLQIVLSSTRDIIGGKTSLTALLENFPTDPEFDESDESKEKKTRVSDLLKDNKFTSRFILQGVVNDAIDDFAKLQNSMFKEGLIKDQPKKQHLFPDGFTENLKRIESIYSYAKVANMGMVRRYIDERMLTSYFSDGPEPKKGQSLFNELLLHFSNNDLSKLKDAPRFRAEFSSIQRVMGGFKLKWLNRNSGIFADGKMFSSPEELVYLAMVAMDEAHQTIGKRMNKLVVDLHAAGYNFDKKIAVDKKNPGNKITSGAWSQVAYGNNMDYFNAHHVQVFKIIFPNYSHAPAPSAGYAPSPLSR